MTEKNSNHGEPQLDDSGHIAGFRFNDSSDDAPTVKAEDSKLTVKSNTAGIDEPEPTMRDKDELDELAGPEPESNPEEGQSPDSNPWGGTSEDLLPDGWDWALPDDSDTDGEGRTGFLSTRTEVHALVLGMTAGGHFGLSGDAQMLNDILGLGVGSDRARRAQHMPEKYQDQAKQEMPYFVLGVAVGYGLTRANVITELGVGV